MKRCLVLYVKYPEPGNVKTRLGRDIGEHRASELYRDMAERVLTEIYPLGQSYDLRIYCDPTRDIASYKAWLGTQLQLCLQQGDSLGDRLQTTVQEVFALEYEQVIIIGSDCLGLDEDIMNTWFSHLDQRDIVIGPALDGGYYLIGMTQAHVELFDQIPWSTDAVLDATLARVEHQGLSHLLLEKRIDIDTLDDLTAFRETLNEEHFLAKKIDRLVLDRLASLEDATDME